MEDPKASGRDVLMFLQAVAAVAWHIHELNTPDEYLDRFNGYLDHLIAEEVEGLDGSGLDGVEYLRDTFVAAVLGSDPGGNGRLKLL